MINFVPDSPQCIRTNIHFSTFIFSASNGHDAKLQIKEAAIVQSPVFPIFERDS